MEKKKNILAYVRGLGFRIVKTGIAVTLCLCVVKWLNLPHPLYVVLTAVLAMGASIEGSFHMAKNYIFGILCGIVVGSVSAFFLPGNAGAGGIGAIVTLYLCSLLHLRGAEVLSCAAFFFSPADTERVAALAAGTGPGRRDVFGPFCGAGGKFAHHAAKLCGKNSPKISFFR